MLVGKALGDSRGVEFLSQQARSNRGLLHSASPFSPDPRHGSPVPKVMMKIQKDHEGSSAHSPEVPMMRAAG